MDECEKLSACLFFNDKLQNMPAISGMMKERYCKKDKLKCARYRISQALGKDKVPIDLFPNMEFRANQIIALNKNNQML